MNQNFKKCLFVAALAVFACSMAGAQNHALTRTYIDAGYYGSGLNIPGDNQLTPVGNSIDIDCPGSGTCTLEADQSVQQTAGYTARNEFQIGFYLDGKAQLTFQATGETPSDGSSLVSSTREFLAIPAGTHTVQIGVESENGCYVDNYSTVFHVYRP
jgi:hypothetical protein